MTEGGLSLLTLLPRKEGGLSLLALLLRNEGGLSLLVLPPFRVALPLRWFGLPLGVLTLFGDGADATASEGIPRRTRSPRTALLTVGRPQNFKLPETSPNDALW